MNRQFYLVTGLLLCVLQGGMAGCVDSPEGRYDGGRLISDVVIATSMTVFRGMEVTVSGNGFAQGDKIALRNGKSDFAASTTVMSAKQLTLVVPEEVTNDEVYGFALLRGDKRQTLGRSRLTVKLAMGVELGKVIKGYWNEPAAIRGRGFRADDKLLLDQGKGILEAEVKGADDGSLSFVIPREAVNGECRFTLQRGGEKQELGSASLDLDHAPVAVPDHEGATIKGCVQCDGKGIEGVRVSDGDDIVTTDVNGFYYLTSAKRNAVAFVIMPSGYEASTVKAMPQFWKATTAPPQTVEQLDFHLLKVDNDNHTMLVATDMHLANRNNPRDYLQFENGFAKEIRESYNTSAGKVYMLNLGDFSWDAYWYDNKWALDKCKKSVEGFNFPMWSAMGNHDNDGYVASDFGAEAAWRREIGPVYYSMNIGKVHYIMLDDTEYVNTGASQGTMGKRNYNVRFDAPQIEWLKKDLGTVDRATPVVIGIHCPIWSYNTAGKVGVSTALGNFLGCLNGFSNVTILTGHTHFNRCIQPSTHPHIFEHNIAAVCGTWWWTEQYAANNVCIDGSPAGYKVFEVRGTDLSWRYKSVGVPAAKQFVTYDMNEVKNYWTTHEADLKKILSGSVSAGREKDYKSVGENVVRINVWAAQPDWTVSVTENGTALEVKQVWNTRDPLHTISYDLPRALANKGGITFPSEPCTHMFEVTASSPSSTLEVKVTDGFGNIHAETMTRPKALATKITD